MLNKVKKTNYVSNSRSFSFLFIVIVLLSVLLQGSRADGNSTKPSCEQLRSLARIYIVYGFYAKAQPFAESALALAITENASDEELGLCYADLAILYNHQGMQHEAEKMCTLGLEHQKEALGEEHPYIAYTLRTLASIYREQGEYDQARVAIDKAISIMIDSHSASDSVIAPFKVDLAKLLVAQGNLAEAENYYQEVLKPIEIAYGPDHLYTAEVQGDVARLYMLEHKYEQAEPLIAKTLEVQKKIYGQEHHLIAPTLITMAGIYKAQGKDDQAKNLIQEARLAVGKTGDIVAIARLEQLAGEVFASNGKEVALLTSHNK